MSTVLDGDLIMVERGNTVYKEYVDNWINNGNSTDLCVVERNNVCYKESFADLRTRGPYSDSTTTVNLTNTSGTPQVSQATTLPTTFYNVGSGDYSGAYRTCDTRVNVWYSNGAYRYQDGYWTGTLYFGQRNTAGTSWQGDMSIGNIQILQGNGRAYRSDSLSNRTPGGPQDWCFQNSTGAGSGGWYTSTNTVNYSGTPATPQGLSYTSMGWGAYTRRWARANSTGSSYCGANNGTSPYNTSVSSSYNYYHGAGGKILPAHNGSVSQYSNSAYAFVEWSGTSTYDTVWMRTVNQVKIMNGDILRFSYGGGMGQNGTVGTSTSGTFWWYLS